MISGIARTAALVCAIVIGLAVPHAHGFSWMIRWLVMAMLFLVFLQTRLTRSMLQRSHFVLLGANIGMGFLAWTAGWLVGGRDVALSAFFAGITPTATAAPVVMSFLKGRVDYVVAAFLLTNIAIAALIPVMLPPLLGNVRPEAFVHVLGSVALVVFAPMAAAWLLRTLHPAAMQWPARLRTVSFSMWVLALFLITSNASHFLRTQVDTPSRLVVQIGTITLGICAANFATGYLIGGRELRREASQSLGQKNTTFTIYLALTYANPVIALGPTFYVIWHNVWNSWQLHRAGRKSAAAS